VIRSNWHAPRRPLALALALALAVGAAVADPAVRSLVTRPFEATGTTVLPERYLRGWDPVTVFYTDNRGPAKGGPEDHPERYASLSPDWPGAWSWVDARTLQFKPADPWPPLGAFQVRAGGGTVSLATLSDPPYAVTPADGREGLDPVDTITLTFRAPVEPEVLARMLSIETATLPGLSGSRWRSSSDFTIKRLYTEPTSLPGSYDASDGWRDGGQGYVYAVVLEDPIPASTRATVHLRLSRDEDQAAGGRWSASFSTAADFRLAQAGCPGSMLPVPAEGATFSTEAPLSCDQRSIVLTFTASPGEVRDTVARDMVQLTPSVPDLAFSLRDRDLIVTGAFLADQPYRVTVTPGGLQDVSGRPLAASGPTRFVTRFSPVQSYARWVDGQGLLERLGPKTVPLEMAGDDDLDLRIYKIDPLDAAFWPMDDGPLSVDESARPPEPGEEPTWPGENASEYIDPATRARFVQLLGSPPVSVVVSPPRASDRAGRTALDLAPHLARISGKDRPGTYLVGLRRSGGDATRQYMRVQVTDLTLTAVEESDAVRFVVTSLATGSPVSGATIRLQGQISKDGTAAWADLATLRTGGDGVAILKAPGPDGGSPRPRRVVVQKGDDSLVLDTNQPPPSYADNHWSERGRGWLSWPWRDLDGRVEPVKALCHLWTERPVYRPEEEVHIQAWVREQEAGRLSIASGDVSLAVNGPPGTSWTFPLKLDDNGGVYQRLDELERPTGGYTATLRRDGRVLCTTSFQTEAYRIPTFEVSLQGPATARTDRPFPVALTASYYAGGKLADRPIRWRVTRYPAQWQPPTRAGYVFASDARFSGMTPTDVDARLEQEGRTDMAGGASLTLDPTREPDARPRSYVVEATVTAEDASTVTTTTRVDALPAFVLGAKVPRYVDDGLSVPLELLAVDSKGALSPGQKVSARLSRREWHSVLTDTDITSSAPRYRTDTVDVRVAEKELVTGADPVKERFAVDRSGVYVLELVAHDALNRAQKLSVDLYVAGPGDQAWSKPQAGVFTLAPDKDAYDPGQTANIVLQSPFSSARALAVVETPDGNRYQWLDVHGGAATLKVNVQKTWTPKIPVHVVLMRGRSGDTSGGAGLDLGKPATVASTIWLPVNPVENQVAVSVDAPARALPGDTVPVTVKLKTPAGKPLSGEVALWLVDAAVLSLGKEARLDPLPSFLYAMRSRLVVSDTRNLAYGRIPFPAAPGGDGGEEGGLLEHLTVRKDMKPVPYYEPHLVVGASGTATVRIKLPDNLTVFKIRAKASSGPDRFGVGTGEIAVRQPVVVQPALPRFVRPGDRFVATAVGRVVEGSGGQGAAEIRAEGLEVQGSTKQTINLDLNAPALATFQVVVPTPTLDASGHLVGTSATVRLGVRRDADGAGDAFETVLPIRDDQEEILDRRAVALEPGKNATLPAIPDARPGSLRRAWVASDVPGVLEAAGAASALARWPYGDTPALLARARAWIALGTLRGAVSPGEGTEGAAAALKMTTDALDQRLDSHGLVAAFPGGSGRVWLTASASMMLSEARDANLQVPRPLQLRLQEALRGALRSDSPALLTGEEQVERSLALLALARAGQLDEGYFAELARTARISDLDGVSSIIRAGGRGSEADRARARSLVPTLVSAIVPRLSNGREVYDHLKDQRGRDSRIQASEARTLAGMVRALQELSPDELKLPLLRQALLDVGGADGWGSPDADAEALLALVERLRAPPDAAWTVSIADGATNPTLRADKAAIASVVTTTGGTASVSADRALQLWVESRYLPAVDGSNARAEAAGFVVDRTLERVGPHGEPGERVALDGPGHSVALRVGDLVEEHVRIVTPKDRGFVAVVVPLAAGMELMNPRLATAPPEATPRSAPSRQSSWQDWHDDEVIYYYESLPAGTLELSFRARATTAGSFVQPPARVAALQDRAVRGGSNGARLEISQK